MCYISAYTSVVLLSALAKAYDFTSATHSVNNYVDDYTSQYNLYTVCDQFVNLVNRDINFAYRPINATFKFNRPRYAHQHV